MKRVSLDCSILVNYLVSSGLFWYDFNFCVIHLVNLRRQSSTSGDSPKEDKVIMNIDQYFYNFKSFEIVILFRLN